MKKQIPVEIDQKTFDALYEGYREYILRIKGYFTCASKGDIKMWEEYKDTIYTAILEDKKK